MAYKAAIFDLDGTLLDTIADVHAALNDALAEQGLPEQTLGHTRASIGNGAAHIVDLSVPEGTPGEARGRVLASFKARYAAHDADLTRPFGGVEGLLGRLQARDVPLAVVSNKMDEQVRGLVGRYFPRTFDAVVGEREGIRRKPAPDSVLEVARVLGVPASDCVYVGDSEVDVLTASNAGCACVGVSWGYRGRRALLECGAPVVVDDCEGLARAIMA